MSESNPSHPDSVVCPPSRDPLVRLFIVAAMLTGFGVYTIYDHYIQGNYPYPNPYALNPYLKYLFNHYIPYLLIPPGLAALFLALRGLRRVMVADGEGIGYQGQAKIAWGGIKRVDSSMLQSKGVLDLYDASGRKLRLDAWYLTNFRDLVAFVEKRVPVESLDSH